ncbi:cupin domain-containing protein [Altererythrobacter sp. Root672]|uniref:cupin domain-containing protein n=1 Tax=Altererythrobacter sp. Root672 TaxID=1736584 RepID=UPI0006F9972F|nr:cupin domain-containing protein [Altererythrobacter sp. Root672]KRA81199.1 hypothetical protein ASD76_11485 [Altererythrobacter sp. Root672]
MAMTTITRRGAVVGFSALVAGSAAVGQASLASHLHPAASSTQKEGEAFRFLALKMFLEASSEDTNGATAVLRIFVPPGEGAAPHVHSREDEVFTIVRGHYRFRHGDEEVDAPAGTALFMPKGIPHTFRNIGTEPGEHVLTLIPGGLEKMFREASDAGLQMPRDRERYTELAARYGVRTLPPDSLPFSPGG